MSEAATLMTAGATTPEAAASTGVTTTPTPTATAAVPPVEVKPQEQTPAITAPESEAPTEAKPAERVAPEKYEWKAAEGQAFDPDVLGEFEGVARELKMSQEEAQSVVSKMAPKIAERMAAQQAELLNRAGNEWEASAKADKEFGGDKLDASMATAKRALDAFGTPELRNLLNESRFGNHPELIRFMVRAGKAISEEKVVTGATRTPTGPQQTLADRLYGTNP